MATGRGDYLEDRQMKRLGLLLLVLAAPLAAQDSTATKHVREGFWFRFGVGYGFIDGSFGGDISEDLEASSSLSGFIALGGQITPDIGIGATVNAYYEAYQESKEGDSYLSAGIVAPTLFWHTKNSGFYGQLAVGIAFHQAADSVLSRRVGVRFGSRQLRGTGIGVLLGAGIDIRFDRILSISPYVNLIYSRIGGIWFEGRILPGVHMNTTLIQVGASLTVH